MMKRPSRPNWGGRLLLSLLIIDQGTVVHNSDRGDREKVCLLISGRWLGNTGIRKEDSVTYVNVGQNINFILDIILSLFHKM